MPRGLCIDKPQSVALREYEDAPLTEDQLRIRTEFASIKHGTEFHLFSGQSPFGGRYFDPALRLFVEDGGAKSQDRAVGQFVGNMAVGVVTETGTAVTRFRMGDRVYRKSRKAPAFRRGDIRLRVFLKTRYSCLPF